MRYSVLTFNFGNYEILRDPEEVNPEVEYICVTDNPNLKSKIWRIIVCEKRPGSNVYNAFYVRWHPFEFVTNDICLVLDGSMQIHKIPSNLMKEFQEGGYTLGLMLRQGDNPKTTMIHHQLERWLKRDLPKEDYYAGMDYIAKNFPTRYHGYIQAGLRLTRRSGKTQEIELRIWNKIVTLGNPFRVDQVPYSVEIQKRYPREKYLFLDRRIIEGKFISLCVHNSNSRILSKNLKSKKIYFRNRLIKPFSNF